MLPIVIQCTPCTCIIHQSAQYFHKHICTDNLKPAKLKAQARELCLSIILYTRRLSSIQV